jgi:hypothetical protein
VSSKFLGICPNWLVYKKKYSAFHCFDLSSTF